MTSNVMKVGSQAVVDLTGIVTNIVEAPVHMVKNGFAK
jgi:hypothetical protein